METVAVHPTSVVLFLILLILCLAIVILGRSLLARPDREEADTPALIENFEDVLRAVEDIPPPAEDNARDTTDFVFRRRLAQSLATPPESPSNSSPPPKAIDFSTIQREIRAALGTATQETEPASSSKNASLKWTEPDRLAVLSLGNAKPQTAWSLMQTQGIHILIVPETHPFPAPNRNIELICLPDHGEPDISALISKLRAKLTKGERIAFYTEAGLSGPTALLAARLSSRTI